MAFRPMSTAPKGKYIDQKGPKGKTVKVFRRKWILTASPCGKYIMTHWIPEQERWNLYSKKTAPLGWFPVPDLITKPVEE